MSGRSDKPHATGENIKAILSRPVRPLTDEERAERTTFEGFAGNNAQAVEPGTFAKQR